MSPATLSRSTASPSRSGLRVGSPVPLAGLSLWLKAETITGLADGAVIPTWRDSSPAGNHATGPASAGQKPTYKTGIVKGRPVVRFHPAGRFMVLPTMTSQTVFFAHYDFDTTTFSDYRRLMDASPGINAHSLFGVQRSSNYNPGGTWPSNFPATNCWVNGKQTISALPFQAWKVVSAVATAPKTGPHWIGTYSSGNGAQSLLADVAEVLFYDRALPASERTAVERYLRAKWGTP